MQATGPCDERANGYMDDAHSNNSLINGPTDDIHGDGSFATFVEYYFSPFSKAVCWTKKAESQHNKGSTIKTLNIRLLK